MKVGKTIFVKKHTPYRLYWKTNFRNHIADDRKQRIKGNGSFGYKVYKTSK